MLMKQPMRARFLTLVVISGIAPLHAQTLPSLVLKIGGVAISVEVADTPATRARGLMYRRKLAHDRGMLFVFPQAGYHGMWMSNTYIPLSVAFVDADGKIINIDDMQPLTTNEHAPAAPVQFVLEMNRGWFHKHNVRPGDNILGLDAAPKGQ